MKCKPCPFCKGDVTAEFDGKIVKHDCSTGIIRGRTPIATWNALHREGDPLIPKADRIWYRQVGR